MAIYTQLSSEEAEHIIAPYNLGPLEEITPMPGGQANSSFKVKISSKTYVLSVADEKTPDEVQRLTTLLHYLVEHLFPTTGVLKALGGFSTFEVNDKPVYLKEYIEGAVHDQLNRGQLFQIGQQLARLHRIPPHPELLNHHSYGIGSFNEVFETASEDQFGSWLKDKTEMLNQKLNPDLPRGLIHGDLFSDNTVFAGDQLVAVLDFEEACNYFKVFDLGMCAIGACVENQKISFDLFKALLSGYESFRKLGPEEREQLKLHTEYAAIATAFWRFRQYHLRNPAEDKKTAHAEMKQLADDLAEISNESFWENLT